MLIKTAKTWFLSIDKSLILMMFGLLFIGCLLVASSSPVIASKLNLPNFYFIKKHIFNVFFGLAILFAFTTFKEDHLRRLCLLLFIFFTCMLVVATFFGTEIKGARRWIAIAGFNMQPSEFLKPFYIVVMARILSLHLKISQFPRYKIAIALHAFITLILLKQPDLGMTVTFTVLFITMLFIAGLPLYWLALAGIGLFSIVGIAYFSLPHVAFRINSFFASSGANYQVSKSLDAYNSGGIFGQGPLGGNIKNYLPDCHTDFIFAVAGEEFGALFSVLIIFLILLITIKIMVHALKVEDEFKKIAITGIASLYAFQSIFNIAVTLNLLPTKGMTLPFISYGGSSMFAYMILFGILLNFSKRDLYSLNFTNKFRSEE